MDEFSYRLVSLFGFCLIATIAWMTGNRGQLSVKTLAGSLLLIWILGGMIFWLPLTRTLLRYMNDILVSVLQASQKGSQFLFGPLALSPGTTLPDGTASIGFVLAMQVLPAVIFFAALISGLYYLGVMQVIVRVFANLFYRLMRLSGAEALSASANIFVGIESGLTVRPYLPNLTRSELLTLLTCMMATVASTVLGVYVFALHRVFPQIAGHLISASVLSIPCAILISKLSVPEDDHPETLEDLPQSDDRGFFQDSQSGDAGPANLMVALIDGGTQGLKMAAGIATLLIVVLGLEAVVDLALVQLPHMEEAPLSLSKMLGWFTWPFTVLLGLQPEEWQAASEILGTRFIETEVTAYFKLAAAQGASPPVFSDRSMTILTYALCGFVHLASMGVFVGGLSVLMPDRLKDLSVLGFRALWCAFLATLLTGCVAGVLA